MLESFDPMNTVQQQFSSVSVLNYTLKKEEQ